MLKTLGLLWFVIHMFDSNGCNSAGSLCGILSCVKILEIFGQLFGSAKLLFNNNSFVDFRSMQTRTSSSSWSQVVSQNEPKEGMR